MCANRCFRLSPCKGTHCSAVYSLPQPAARHVYNTLISMLQMDMGPLAAAPCLMINEQHLEPHVLPPRSPDMSFRTRHFVSSVKNELLGVVHYPIPTARSLPCIFLHAKPCAMLVPRVGVHVTLHLTHLSRQPSSKMHTAGLTVIWDRYKGRQVNRGRPDSRRGKDFGAPVEDTLLKKPWHSRKVATFLLCRHTDMTMA